MVQLVVAVFAAFLTGGVVGLCIAGAHHRRALIRAEALGFKKGELAAWQESTQRLIEAAA